MKKRALFSGAVRPYDLQNPRVKVGYILMTIFCVFSILFALMPVVWVILSGFKDLKEFNRGVKAADNHYYQQFLPVSFSLDEYIDTWNQMKYVRYYLNSLFVVLGSVVTAVLCNGLLAYGISRLKPRGWKIVYGYDYGNAHGARHHGYCAAVYEYQPVGAQRSRSCRCGWPPERARFMWFYLKISTTPCPTACWKRRGWTDAATGNCSYTDRTAAVHAH